MIQKELLLILAAVLLVCSVADLAGAGGVDVNDDGVVDTADLEFVDRHIGTTGEHAADVNDDNIVNITDLVLVKNAIGTTSALTGMVLIPAGSFRMGSNAPEADSDEQPVHTVYVDAFYMDKYEVTNAEYAAFLNAKGKHIENGIVWFGLTNKYALIERVGGRYRAKAGYANHPVIEVSWYGAMAYAAWAGKRLPTEAEWEKAARGGLAGQKYPWGNAAPNGTQCNFADKNTDYSWSDKSADDGYHFTAPVGSYPPNAYGLYDMAGNVWEWCLDAYDSDFYSNSPRRNPIAGADSINHVIDNYIYVKSSRVLRGGSWGSYALFVRVADRNRYDPTFTYYFVGFRCARTVTP